MTVEPKHRILFVCLGNICRSPAAQGIMQDIVSRQGQPSDWLLDSAGTGGYHVGQLPDLRMRIHARSRGLDLNHRCRQVTESDFDRFDLIVAMDRSNSSRLRAIAPTTEAEAKIVEMADYLPASAHYDHIPDPYYEGDDGFELVLDLLQQGCQNLFNRLSNTPRQ